MAASSCPVAQCTKNLACIGGAFQHLLLLIIRLYWGIGFLLAGTGKFGRIGEVTGFFSKLDIPFPAQMVYLVATVETVGGLLLLLGLVTRLTTLPLIAVMCVAFATAHQEALLGVLHDPETFFQQAPFLFLYALLILFAFGPGKISIDGWRDRQPSTTGCCQGL
ncbi:MAG: DoxX family protein [Deltaproteobacteria bacterium]|nr:DoxX family protein [Deltaproteobacteria bacterium]